MPLFSNDLAYEDEHEPAIGVINMPLRQQMVVAGRGLGCWVLPGPDLDLQSGRRARVTERTSLGGARTLMHNPAGWPEELLSALHRRVFLSPSTGMIAALVTGWADAGVIAGPPMGYEDVAPMPVIVTEAGGKVTDLGGTSVLRGDTSVLVTNGRLHDQFVQLVEDLPRSRDWQALVDRD
ncbi:inositol monophosphatase [Streptomyces yunnanensis]|uniref:Inositol monophosphatase n=1 Tax=Streptomyces yunnanensis TaxID=156453 RepID=A0ABY8APF9_9ACTN|nr:inositol monophosphatase family protein [Streptomyces yunnanensis]WEB45461.1 inositol monophosphatase [Streptomyces yunnanensis]